MGLANLLDGALRAAGIPIVGVRIGRDEDRRTWSAVYLQEATDEQRATGDAIVALFDPDSQLVKDGVLERESRALGDSLVIRAFWLYWFRETHGKDPDDADRAAADAKLLQAYKDEATRVR